MSKTIEQLRAQASQIEEATRQGENTQIRVGGLFQDIIDFIGQIPINETALGPLLTALNNSGLIEPSDGQSLVFSIMKDGWTFSDALTQLKISQQGIEQTVTSNYEAFLSVKDQLQREIAATDQRVRNYKTDYDNSQLEYSTWKVQTDTQIAQYAVAIDKNTGDIASISGRVDTAFDQLDFVTNNLEASDKALNNLLDLTGLNYTDPPGSYSASWLYKNRQGIYGAAANFDEDGNILQSSVLAVTVDGINADIRNVDGKYTTIQADVNGLKSRVGSIEGTYSEILQEEGRIRASVNTLDGRVGSLEVGVTTFVTHDELGNEVERQITSLNVSANQINFSDFTREWVVRTSPELGNQVIFRLSRNGVFIRGQLYADSIFHSLTIVPLNSGDTHDMADNNPDLSVFTLSAGTATVRLPKASYYENCMILVYTASFSGDTASQTFYIRSKDGSIVNLPTGSTVNYVSVGPGCRLEFFCEGGQWYLLSNTQ